MEVPEETKEANPVLPEPGPGKRQPGSTGTRDRRPGDGQFHGGRECSSGRDESAIAETSGNHEACRRAVGRQARAGGR